MLVGPLISIEFGYYVFIFFESLILSLFIFKLIIFDPSPKFEQMPKPINSVKISWLNFRLAT